MTFKIKDFPVLQPIFLHDFTKSEVTILNAIVRSGSPGSFWNKAGALNRRTVQNASRIEYGFPNNECKGLLIESRRTNLLTNSGDYTSDDWAYGNTSIDLSVGTRTLGILTGYKLKESVTNGEVENTSTHIRRVSTVGLTSGRTVTQSWIVEAAERENVLLRAENADGYVGRGRFNLIDGDFSVDASGASNGVKAGSKRLTSSVWLIWITYPVGSGNFVDVRLETTSRRNGPAANNGDGVSGIWLYGTQLEYGINPTSYIPTTTSQVTRVGDFYSVPFKNMKNFTIVADYIDTDREGLASVVNLTTATAYGTGIQSAALHATHETGRNGPYLRVNGVNQINVGNLETEIVKGKQRRIVAGISPTVARCIASHQGPPIPACEVTGDFSSLPEWTHLVLGSIPHATAENLALESHIQRIAVYPRLLSMNEMYALAKAIEE